MSTLREAAQRVLEALEEWHGAYPHRVEEDDIEVAEALRAALAEPVQEPVAWIHTDPDKRRVKFLEWRENEPGYRGDWIKTPLYTDPPQRKPLTEEEIDSIWDSEKAFADIYAIARAIERAHGIT